MTIRAQTFVAFCRQTLGLRLTRGQRVLCSVAFDGVPPSSLKGDDAKVAASMFGDVEAVAATARRVLSLTLGRGSGKTTLSAAYGLWRMVTGDISACGPGDVPSVVVVAPTRPTAKLAVSMALALARGAPSISSRLRSVSDGGFALLRADRREVAFRAFAASRGGASARGISVLSFILDEAQFFRSGSEFLVTDGDVFNAIIPRLLPGGAGVLISTPWPVPTLMADLHLKNFGEPRTALAALASTLTMRDEAAEFVAMVALERLRDADNAAREYDCDLSLSGSGTFFDRDAIKASIDPDLLLPSSGDGMNVHFGADLAFARDASALAGVGRHGDVYTVLSLSEMRPSKGAPLRPKHVIDTFAATILGYGVDKVVADNHYRQSAVENLEPHGIVFVDAPAGSDGKAESYLMLKRIMHEGRLHLPNHPRLIAQLSNVVAKEIHGGGTQIISPRRTGLGHGDLCSAVVCAVWQAAKKRPRRPAGPGSTRTHRDANGATMTSFYNSDGSLAGCVSSGIDIDDVCVGSIDGS